MSKAWMPMYWGDYFANTRDLTTLQHGAFLLLIGHYWEHKSLPTNDTQLATIVGLPTRAWKNIKGPIAAKFQDDWKHPRIERELAIAQKKQIQRQLAGHKGGMASVMSRSVLQGQIASTVQAEVKRSLKRNSIERISENEPNGEAKLNIPVTNHISKKERGPFEGSVLLEEVCRQRKWTP